MKLKFSLKRRKKMKKKVLALLLASVMVVSMFAGCSGSSTDTSSSSGGGSDTPATSGGSTDTPATSGGSDTPAASGDRVINVMSFTQEIPDAFSRFKELNPSFDWEINSVVINDEAAYPTSLQQALQNGGPSAPDIYMAESAYVLMFTQGDWASYAAPYEDLISNLQGKLSDAQVAQYVVDVGTRNGTIVALNYQATGSCLIYRRSIAIDTWGSDDPDLVASKTGPGWDKFLEGAADLKAKGYYAVYSLGDLFKAVRDAAAQGWIVNDSLVIDPAREYAFDLAKQMHDNGYWVGGGQWTEGWAAAQSGDEVFAFLGPAWMINYVIAGNAGDTAGDWAVTVPPAPFSWGGTWLISNKAVLDASAEKQAAIAQLIEWVTLDTSDTGFQYFWANGTLNGEGGTKDTVASGTVMAKSNGELDFLGGQNMFDYFIPAGATASATNWTQYDGQIEGWFTDQITQYYEGTKTKEQAIADFRQRVLDELGFE
jgi:hypothetical protein